MLILLSSFAYGVVDTFSYSLVNSDPNDIYCGMVFKADVTNCAIGCVIDNITSGISLTAPIYQL